MKKRTLRQRLIVSTVLVVTITSTLFAIGVLMMKQRLEEATFGSMVREHLQVLLKSPKAASVLTNPLFDEWRYYRGDAVALLPGSILDKQPGAYHSIKIEGHYFHLQVAEGDHGKVYLMYDITEWEHQEHALLQGIALGVVIVLVLAILIAIQSANSILKPLKRLTEKLATITPAQRNLRIAADFQDSDVGQIASAFDTYSTRLDAFVEREQSFTTAASHELRTPLSVMLGAVDVIESNQSDASRGRAIDRIRRACGEMQAFIEATLFIAREENSAASRERSHDLETLIRQLLEDSQQLIKSKNIQVEIRIFAPLKLNQPDSIVKITLANLFRNALEHTENGSIILQVDRQTFVITDTGEGIDASALPHIFDRSYTTKSSGVGLGLNLVKRICDRFDWRLNVSSDLNKGTEISIHFPATAVAHS